jgi:adenosylhomocysteine nucleosidase
MKRIAIIAALPGELRPLVRGWQHVRSNGVDIWRTSSKNAEWIAACAGMGQHSATRAFAEIEKGGPIDGVISVGWAGALHEGIEVGKAYRAAGVIDLRTGERFIVDGALKGAPWLVTSPGVAGAADKRRLAVEYRAGLVDMEAAAIARLAAMRGILFQCIKGVSDGFGENLPDSNRFISPQGRLMMGRLLLFVLPRPWCWPALIRMGENSRKASHTLAGLLLENLEISGDQSNPNGDSNFSR